LKFVIADRNDYEYARGVLELSLAYSPKSVIVHFSPCYGRITLKELSEWILDDSLNVRLHIQLHKFIWGPYEKSV